MSSVSYFKTFVIYAIRTDLLLIIINAYKFFVSQYVQQYMCVDMHTNRYINKFLYM